jgi:TolB protein
LIAYAAKSADGGDAEIHVMTPEGTDDTTLTDNGLGDNAPDWSPDGKQIVFSYGAPGHESLFTMNADGTNRRLLAKPDPNGLLYPKWSPDGDWILFSSSAYLFSVRSNGAGQKPVGDLQGDRPDWSPDGLSIAFDALEKEDGHLGVFIATKSGADRHLVVGNTSGGPSWSPDGQWIAFVSSPLEDPVSVLRAIASDGGDAVGIFDSGADITFIDWSPVDED